MSKQRYEIGSADYEYIEIELADMIDTKGNLEILAYYEIVDNKIMYYNYQLPEDNLIGGKAHKMNAYQLGVILQKQHLQYCYEIKQQRNEY